MGDQPYDIFFSLRLHEAKAEALQLKTCIEQQQPGVRCFVSGDNQGGGLHR